MQTLNEKQIKFFEDLQTTMQKGAVQPSELAQVIKAFLEILNNVKTQLQQNIQNTDMTLRLSLNTAFDDIKTLEKKMSSSLGEVSSKSEKMTLAEVSKMASKMEKDMAQMKGDMPQMPDLSEIENRMAECEKICNEIEIPEIDEIEKDLPKLREPIRNALESFTDENEKLKIDAIGFLREELDELKRMIISSGSNTVVYAGGGGSSGGGRIVKSYDLSSSLNGVLKTFTLPAFFRIISIHSTSSPNVFRETVDYTSDASAMTITFTSEINASTTLASGQSIIIIYSE